MKFKTLTAVAAMATLAACNSGAGDKGATDTAATDAPAAPAAAATAITLLPLTEADNQPFTLGVTCGLSNDQGNFLQTRIIEDPEGGDNITTQVALRTNEGLTSCVLDKAAGTGISDAQATFQCGGVQVALAQKGPKTDDADDSGQPATLTVTRGAQTATVDGAVDCAI